MPYWLMKSEPDEFSIDDLVRAPRKTTPWFGVRNYQARNYMRDAMRAGDGVLFYHSSCEVPGIAGLAEVSSMPYPDPTQFDPKSPYFDPKATRENPRWMLVDVTLSEKDAAPFPRGTARARGTLRHGHPAPGKPPVGHAGGLGRVEIHREAPRARCPVKP